MTWAEIKRAVAEAGIGDEEEISVIQCSSNGGGEKTFHVMRLGKSLRLAEETSDDRKEFAGCAV